MRNLHNGPRSLVEFSLNHIITSKFFQQKDVRIGLSGPKRCILMIGYDLNKNFFIFVKIVQLVQNKLAGGSETYFGCGLRRFARGHSRVCNTQFNLSSILYAVQAALILTGFFCGYRVHHYVGSLYFSY